MRKNGFEAGLTGRSHDHGIGRPGLQVGRQFGAAAGGNAACGLDAEGQGRVEGALIQCDDALRIRLDEHGTVSGIHRFLFGVNRRRQQAADGQHEGGDEPEEMAALVAGRR